MERNILSSIPNVPSDAGVKGAPVTNKLNNDSIHKVSSDNILSMFREERQKIVYRGEECARLLDTTNKVLEDILTLKKLYVSISPRSSELHSECKNIIQERNDLRESYERINLTLSKKEERRSIFRRMPEIKNQVLSTLNMVCQDYQKRQQPEGTPLDEYYGRFFIECRRIKELTSQLESCLLTSSTDELLLHLEEIYTIYFDIREQLIEPVFTKSIRGFVSRADRNYCDLLRQSCACLVRILRNEIQLFGQVFPSPLPDAQQLADDDKRNPVKRQALNNYLEQLCRIFYEHLRPVIIHVNHLETLAELHKLVTDTMRTEVLENSYQAIMNSLAEDIQERMVFRAEVFIQESVLDYKPSRGDLAYPEKLEIVTGGELKDFQAMWYPTVQRTVLALFYLNRVFDPLTFRELAQEIVFACLKSLDLAQKLIDERHGGTKIEATLFLSKHLAIIKDQMQSYNMEKLRIRVQPRTGGGGTGIEQLATGSSSSPTSGGESTASSEPVEIDSGDLESMLRLFQENEVSAASESDSLWRQLNETIVSGTRWTLRATRMRR